jgi:hypothetical protein
MYVKTVDLPDSIRTALKSVGYGKSDIEVNIQDSVSLFDAGSDGRRGFAIIINLSSGESEIRYGSWGGANAFVTNVIDADDRSHKLGHNCAVVRGSEGYGSTYASLYLDPSNVLPCLKSVETLDEEKMKVLLAFKSLTSAGRKGILFGKDKIINELVELGYLSKSGRGLSITTSGKNICGKRSYF